MFRAEYTNEQQSSRAYDHVITKPVAKISLSQQDCIRRVRRLKTDEGSVAVDVNRYQRREKNLSFRLKTAAKNR